MGRTTNLLNGVVSGRVGAQVGYKSSDPTRPQGVRAYQPNVHNPRTARQAAHRAKLRPAHLFYLAFEPVLNHAFLPDGSAGANRRRFISLATRNSVIPRVLKGENAIPYNVPYQISEGSIALGLDSLVSSEWFDDGIGYGLLFPNFNVEGIYWEELSIAEISEIILRENTALRNGDEITFLYYVKTSSGVCKNGWLSFVIDTSDTLNMFPYEYSLYLAFNDLGRFAVYPSGSGLLLSFGIIITRRVGDKFMYTNSYVNTTKAAYEALPHTEREVIASYMNQVSNFESDNILQQAVAVDTSLRVVSFGGHNLSPSDDFVGRYAGGLPGLDVFSTAMFSNGMQKAVVDGGKLVVINDTDNTFTYIEYTKQGISEHEVKLSMTKYDGCPTITVAELREAGFPLTLSSGGDDDDQEP